MHRQHATAVAPRGGLTTPPMWRLTAYRGVMSRRFFALAFLFALLAVVAVHALDFPGSVTDFTRSSGGGALLDTKPSFSEAMIYERLEAYGEAGRENYAFRNLSVDILLPLSLLPLLLLSMQHGLERVSLGRGPRAFLLFLPLLYLAFDLAENASVLVLLANFPDRVHVVATVLPYLTTLKRAALLPAIVIPLSIVSISFVRSKLTTH